MIEIPPNQLIEGQLYYFKYHPLLMTDNLILNEGLGTLIKHISPENVNLYVFKDITPINKPYDLPISFVYSGSAYQSTLHFYRYDRPVNSNEGA